MLKATSSRIAAAILALVCLLAPVASAFACSCPATAAPESRCCSHPAGCPCCVRPAAPGATMCLSSCTASPLLVLAHDSRESALPGIAALNVPGRTCECAEAFRPSPASGLHGTAPPRASADPPIYLLGHALLR